MAKEPNNSHVSIRKINILRGQDSKVADRFEWPQDILLCIIFAICFLSVVSAFVLAESDLIRLADPLLAAKRVSGCSRNC